MSIKPENCEHKKLETKFFTNKHGAEIEISTCKKCGDEVGRKLAEDERRAR